MSSTTTRAGKAEPIAPPEGRLLETRWSAVTRFAFRFCCVYFLFEWVPLIVGLQTSSLTAGLLSAPDWWGTLNRTLGQWAITHVLGLPEHSPARFSANNLAGFVGMVSVGVIGAAVAVAWSLVDRRRTSHPQVFLWIHTFMRFGVGAIMLFYGWHKVLPGQFDLTFDYLALPVGQHSPRDLLWAFMAASRPYQVFTGLVEVTGGLLLLTRRTAMLGALVSMAAMANVLALDIAYDANVKFLAGQLFLMTLFVLAPYARRLVGMFVLDDEQHDPSVRRLFRRAAIARATRVVGILFVVWVVYSNFQAAERQVNANVRARQAPLYGIWEVEEISRNGVSVPLLGTDVTLWRRLVVQSRDAAVIVPMSDPAQRMPNAGRYAVEFDNSASIVRFAPFAFSGTTQPLAFRYRLPDRDHLLMDELNGSQPASLRLRRIDPSTYTLVNWERGWRW